MPDEPAPDVQVIVIRLWWEEAGAGAVTMRARVTSSDNDARPSWTGGATTTDGVVDAVRHQVERFLAGRSHGTGGAHG